MCLTNNALKKGHATQTQKYQEIYRQQQKIELNKINESEYDGKNKRKRWSGQRARDENLPKTDEVCISVRSASVAGRGSKYPENARGLPS